MGWSHGVGQSIAAGECIMVVRFCRMCVVAGLGVLALITLAVLIWTTFFV